MNTVVLRRLETSDQGTFGHIQFNDLNLFSGELPWLNNQANISCIPAGKYQCSWSYSPRLKRNTYRLLNVPGRTGVLIHQANLVGIPPWKSQVAGCIALGSKLGTMNGQKAIIMSAPAVSQFEFKLERQPFILEIINEFV